MEIKVIITGATGMVGEGVMLECLENPQVKEVLMVNRRHFDLQHAKLKELIVPDFLKAEQFSEQLKGYDACFFCAGISSIGVNEEKFTHATYDTTIHFAETVAAANPSMVFTYVSGKSTDSTEKGKVMWARVKGRTENALMRLPFKRAYNFRPAFMKPMPGQKNVPGIYRFLAGIYPVWLFLFPKWSTTMREVGQAMINAVTKGYDQQIIEVSDIRTLAKK